MRRTSPRVVAAAGMNTRRNLRIDGGRNIRRRRREHLRRQIGEGHATRIDEQQRRQQTTGKRQASQGLERFHGSRSCADATLSDKNFFRDFGTIL